MHAESFRRLADTVESYWGVHLYARIVDDSAEPKTDWYYVSVPRRLLTEDENSLLTVLLHEWGHRTLSPRTIRNSLLWQAIIASEGAGNPPDLLNLICDVWVDRHYLSRENRWSRVYEAGTRRHLELLADNLTESIERGMGDTLEVQRQALLYDLECLALTDSLGQSHTPILPLTLEVWDILTDPSMVEEARVRKAARAVRYLYPPAAAAAARAMPTPAGLWRGAAFGEASSGDMHTLLNDMARLGISLSEAEAARVLGPEKARHIVEDQRVRAAFEALRGRLPDVPGPGDLGLTLEATPTVWRWGDSPQDIDWIGTISSSGVSVPGFTTLRRRREPGKASWSPIGKRTVCVVLDDSGSMWGSKIEAGVDAACGLIDGARQKGDRVSLVVFADEADALPASQDYSTALRRVIRCAASGGGTRLLPALEMASAPEFGPERRLTCIITDGDLADEDAPALRSHLLRLTTHGQVVIFAIGVNPHRRGWMEVPHVSFVAVDPSGEHVEEIPTYVERRRGVTA